MTETSPFGLPRSLRSRHRVVLLASTTCLGIAILTAGSGVHLRLNQPSWSTAAQAAEAAQLPASFADLVAKVKPAVMSVRVKMVGDLAQAASMGQDDSSAPVEPNSPIDKFFGIPDAPNGMPHSQQIITGEGSAFFISSDGYAVTNYHVVDHAKSVQVTTNDGKKYDARVVGTDQKSDLALIKVDGHGVFPYVTFADHAPRVGDWVVAVGNPFGLGGTVTAGIVSARGRDIGSGPYGDFIQIDAPINKGNSGGPAFDVEGRVIGVNTAIFSPSGGSVGIGFDIPADTAKYVVAQLKDKGAVARGWIGVQIQPVTASIAESLGMGNAEGAIVDQPQPNSPAAKAGIEPGDVITAVNDIAVKDSHDLAKRIGMMAPGSSVKLDVLRKGHEKTMALTLGEMPNERQVQAASRGDKTTSAGDTRLGLTVAPADSVAGAGSRGVVVTAVEPDSPAADIGMQTGNVILDVGGKAVSSPADIRNELTEMRKAGKKSVLMRLKSGNATKYVAMPLGHA